MRRHRPFLGTVELAIAAFSVSMTIMTHQDRLVAGDVHVANLANYRSQECVQGCYQEPLTTNRAYPYVGAKACSQCHLSEYRSWRQSNHATQAYDLLRTSSNARRYAANLGIDENRVSQAERCLACHSTPQSEDEKRTGVVHGVTCESCHGPAGGADGWLNYHSSYGTAGLLRELETPEHQAQRVAGCVSRGQVRSTDLYANAKRCYSCHVIGDEELVIQGGHHPGNLGFEMTAWLDKGIRHNFLLDPHQNALAPSLVADPHGHPSGVQGKAANHRRLAYVVSLLVDLEVSFNNRARATDATFSNAANTRALAAMARLEAIAELSSNDSLAKLNEQTSGIQSILIQTPQVRDRHLFFEMARLAGNAAKEISLHGDGSAFVLVR